MFKVLYRKFIQDKVYQILSASTVFVEDIWQKHFGVFFGSQCSTNTEIDPNPIPNP